MSQGLIMHGRRVMWAAALAMGLGATASAGTVIIDANSGDPGDLLVGTGQYGNGASQALTSGTGWYYNETYQGGEVGIRTDYRQVGHSGSAYFETTGATAQNLPFLGKGTVNKSTITYAPGASLGGTLNQLTAFGYDWYRDGLSTTASHLAPSLRLILSNGSEMRTLVYEPYYTVGGDRETDQWITSNALASDPVTGKHATFWSTTYKVGGNYVYKDMAYWNNLFGSYNVVGLSFGAGGGWSGTFKGAVDNVYIGFNNATPTVYNFEVAGAPIYPGAPVPEPTSIAMGLIAGAAGLVMAARRRRTA